MTVRLEFPNLREQPPKLRHSLESEDHVCVRKELLSSCASASILIANIVSVLFFFVFFILESAKARKFDSSSPGNVSLEDSWKTTLVLETNTMSFQ